MSALMGWGGALVGLTLALSGRANAGLWDQFTSDVQKALNGEQLEVQNETSDAPITESANVETVALPPVEAPVGEAATAKQTANLRAGPGANHEKVGSLVGGQSLRILEEQGQWMKIRAQIAGEDKTAWIYAPLVVKASAAARQSPTDVGPAGASQRAEVTTAAAASEALKSEYAGYSAEVRPIKEMMRKGALDDVEAFFAEREKKVREGTKSEAELIDEIGNLRWLERGTLAIDRGRFDEAERTFGYAERLLDGEQRASYTESFLGTGASMVGAFVTGNQEMVPYSAEGYENVLMLNYKSLAYLLEGKREAYNVARRAIDWQKLEKDRFEDGVREAKEKLVEEEGELKSSDEGASSGFLGAQEALANEYKAYDAVANRVPSAYVNPFGYYVAGMIQEYESLNDSSLRNNAKTAYQKALDLNPESEALKNAVRALEKGGTSNDAHLVHVIVGSGFVPEKKMLSYYLPTNNGVVAIKLPIMVPEENPIARIEVHTESGKKLATLSQIADVEAIALRHQKDMEPLRNLRIAMSVVSSVVTSQVLSRVGILGQVANVAREKMSVPDMRSWMTLPAEISAARLQINKRIKKIKLVSFDKNGRRLGAQVVDLGEGGHDFVYARAMDDQMLAYSPDKLWVVANR